MIEYFEDEKEIRAILFNTGYQSKLSKKIRKELDKLRNIRKVTIITMPNNFTQKIV